MIRAIIALQLCCAQADIPILLILLRLRNSIVWAKLPSTDHVGLRPFSSLQPCTKSFDLRFTTMLLQPQEASSAIQGMVYSCTQVYVWA